MRLLLKENYTKFDYCKAWCKSLIQWTKMVFRRTWWSIRYHKEYNWFKGKSKPLPPNHIFSLPKHIESSINKL